MSRLVWSLWLVIVAGFVFAGPLSGSVDEDGVGSALGFTFFILAFATVGALVVSRRPRNPIGWILIGAALAYALGGATVGWVDRGGDRRGASAALWLSSWVWMAGIGPAATFGLLLFPNGRLPSPNWRRVAWLAAAGLVLTIVGIAVDPGPFEDFPQIRNPLGLDAVPWLPAAMATAGALALVGGVVGSIASLFARHRSARSLERQQLKWLTYAGALVAAGVAGSITVELSMGSAGSNLSNTIVSLSLATVPVAMGIAILRHRLFDIDVVIRRTLIYSALTATLGGAYLGLVLLVGLAVGKSDFAVAASTLVVAALFGPARARIQAAVDRRFYRRRYDAGRTLEAFSARLRDELDLDTLRGEIRGVVGETVQPAHVSLWLKDGR